MPRFHGPENISLSTGDVDELTRVGSEVFSPHRLAYRGSNALLSAVEIDRISVISMRYRGESTVVTTENLGYYAVHLPTAGRGTVRFAREEVATAPDAGVVFNPEDRPAMRWSEDLHQYGVKIPLSVMSRQLAVLTASNVNRPLVFAHGRVNRAQGAWFAATRMLVDAVERPGAFLNPMVKFGLEEAFITTLLFTQPSNWTEQLLTGSSVPASAPSAVAHAIDLIEAEPGANWSIAVLCSETGVSARSLQEGFRQAAGTTLTTYVRTARLRHAHRLLRDHAADNWTIAEIASASGFAHLGRFAAAYRDMYGKLPSMDRPRSAAR